LAVATVPAVTYVPLAVVELVIVPAQMCVCVCVCGNTPAVSTFAPHKGDVEHRVAQFGDVGNIASAAVAALAGHVPVTVFLRK
jgi:hypothetical protein